MPLSIALSFFISYSLTLTHYLSHVWASLWQSSASFTSISRMRYNQRFLIWQFSLSYIGSTVRWHLFSEMLWGFETVLLKLFDSLIRMDNDIPCKFHTLHSSCHVYPLSCSLAHLLTWSLLTCSLAHLLTCSLAHLLTCFAAMSEFIVRGARPRLHYFNALTVHPIPTALESK